MKGKLMSKVSKQFRQGDVLLHPVKEIPQDAERQPHQQRTVLAEGEVTSHDHSITAPAKKIRRHQVGADTYLEVLLPVTLEHQEHGSITVGPGLYQVRRQVESWMDEVREVRD